MKLFEKIKEWFKNLFTRVDEWTEQIGEPVINFVKEVQVIVNSDIAEFVVNLTEWKWDDAILEILKVQLPIIIEKMEMTKEKIQELSPIMQEAFYAKLASELSKEVVATLSDKQLKTYEVDAASGIAYAQLKENDRI